MSPAEVLGLSDLNYEEATRELTRRAGGVVLDGGGLLLFAGAHRLPVLCNGVFRTDRRVPPAEVLGRAREFFRGHRRGFTVMLKAHVDDDLTEAASAAGFLAMGNAPGMVLHRKLAAADPPPGVTLERVTTAEGARAFAEVMGAAYASLGMPDDVAPAVLGRLDVMQAPHIVTVLARLEDGTPAAGAMVIVTHGVAGIYWVGTIPAARGRHLAELCTGAAGNAGFDLGGRIAALQASVMGEPVYLRMGYVEVTRYPYLVQVAAEV
jgi:hypothetical protein